MIRLFQQQSPGQGQSYPGARPASVPREDSRLLTCTKCGRVNNPDARFCDWCGAKVRHILAGLARYLRYHLSLTLALAWKDPAFCLPLKANGLILAFVCLQESNGCQCLTRSAEVTECLSPASSTYNRACRVFGVTTVTSGLAGH